MCIFRKAFWLICFSTILLIIGCDSKSQLPQSDGKDNTGNIEKAREYYKKGDFSKSLDEYTLILKKLENSKEKEGDISEASLGIVISKLLSGSDEWKKSYETWQCGERYYWNGTAKTFLEDVSPPYRKTLSEAIKEVPSMVKPLSLVTVLLIDKHYTVAKRLINQEWTTLHQLNYIPLGMGWTALRRASAKTASDLLSIIDQGAMEEQKRERDAGIFIVNILEDAPLSKLVSNLGLFLRDDAYPLERESVSLSRKDSYLASFEENLKTRDLNERVVIIAEDILYLLSLRSPNVTTLTNSALRLIEREEKSVSNECKEILTLQKGLLTLRQGWEGFRVGDLSKSRKIFDTYKDTSPKELQREACLGLALIEWKEGTLPESREWLNKETGRRYPLLGQWYDILSASKGDQAFLEELIKDPEHTQNLLLLDALLRLGESRSAYKLIDTLCESYKTQPNIMEFYQKEKDRIPKSLYIEGNVWEKIE